MWVAVISLFPVMFEALKVGITGRALQDGLLQLHIFNPRDHACDKHKSVDDHPYGGGPGMVMMAAPLTAAIHAAKNAAPQPPQVIYLSPQGSPLDQAKLAELTSVKSAQALILIAGRYEGIDERIIQQEVTEEISIGDYVLSGGELAAMVMIDGMTRLLPGAVGDQASVTTDSISSGLLKYPQYTRPEHFENLPVPKVLLSGNHQEIACWRLQQSLGKTWLKRKDLLAKKHLSTHEKQLLDEFIKKLKN